MKLIDAKDWKAVHFGDRTILRSDRNLYPEADWWALVSSVDVEPMKEPGHFKVVWVICTMKDSMTFFSVSAQSLVKTVNFR